MLNQSKSVRTAFWIGLVKPVQLSGVVETYYEYRKFLFGVCSVPSTMSPPSWMGQLGSTRMQNISIITLTCMVLPIGAPGAPSVLGLEIAGGMTGCPRGCEIVWKGFCKMGCPDGRCEGWNGAWAAGGTEAGGCCIWDCGSSRGFIIGDVMGIGGMKLSGI